MNGFGVNNARHIKKSKLGVPEKIGSEVARPEEPRAELVF